jgi:hypothetical protein
LVESLLCALEKVADKNVSARNSVTLRIMEAASGTEAHCNANARPECD